LDHLSRHRINGIWPGEAYPEPPTQGLIEGNEDKEGKNKKTRTRPSGSILSGYVSYVVKLPSGRENLAEE
jgi:hypothetical protein